MYLMSFLINLMHPCWIKVLLKKKNLTDPKLLKGTLKNKGASKA